MTRETLNCAACGKPVTDSYVVFGGDFFHKECLVCHRCKKPVKTDGKIHEGSVYHLSCYKEVLGLYCEACGQVLGSSWKVVGKKKYHPECFKEMTSPRCGVCGRHIFDEFAVQGRRKFHISCYRNYILPRCHVCKRPIEGPYVMDLLGNRSHPRHGNPPVDVEYCHSCSRIISDATSRGKTVYSDGRNICGYCLPLVIHESEFENARTKVLEVLATADVRGIPTDVDILTMPSHELEAHYGQVNSKNTKGFTRHVISQDSKRPGTSHKIFVLSGLPEPEFCGVLAHELMHIWLYEHRVIPPPTQVEGLCNLMSGLFYESQPTEFARIMLKKLDENPDPIYGVQYRRLKEKKEKMGWKKFLSSFPGGAKALSTV